MGMIMVARRLSPDALRQVRADPSGVHDALHGDHPDTSIDLDKAWHAIHFLLSGSAWETTEGAGEAVLGGEPFGHDVGYGPARALTPERVAVVAAGLRAVDVEALHQRYVADALTAADIYPQVWDEPDVFESYVAPYYDELRSFYLAAADAGEGVLLAVT